MADETRKDYVAEAYETFIKNAADLDPSDPVAAIQAYFDKNASDDLKARVKAEGKTAKGCWTFIEAVARKALGGKEGHIDPAAIYAIAMHWFEDVPKDWNGTSAKQEPNPQIDKPKPKKAKPKKPAETPSEIRKEKAKAKAKAAKPKAKKPKFQQGFFFEMLETPAVGGEGRGDVSPRTEQESEVQG
ncbi:MAG: hypothetical protein IKO72_12460 [Kiritimatiellae bacterium]|nr:hypothetical protein [Kiritimatiellia bacterium]